jgi:myo-inositol-1(or 4)-monophosphatase
MHAHDLTSRLEMATALVRESGTLALTMRQAPDMAIDAKGTRDFATAADRAVEELVVGRLKAAFGDDVLGEEFGGDAKGDRLWIVDPIDGTYNYIHANSRWCVSLGLLIDGVPTLGLIYKPATDHMYIARRGAGATLNGRPLRVSGAQFLEQPLVEVGTSSRKPLKDYLGVVEALMNAGIETRRCGSGAMGLAQVAEGVIDGYAESHINSWDVAAGIVLVTEAGGVVNDFFAGNGLLQGNPILACTPDLQTQLAAITGTPMGAKPSV